MGGDVAGGKAHALLNLVADVLHAFGVRGAHRGPGSEHPADTRGLASDPRTGGHADAPDVSGQRDALERELSRKAAARACRRITTDAYLLGHERISRRNGPTRASERHWCGRSTAASSWRGHASSGGLTEEAKHGPDRRTPSDRGFGAPGESRAQGSHTGPLRVVNFESYESRFQKDRGWRPWVAQHVWRPLLLGGGHGSEELHRRDACRLVALLTARGSAWLWSRGIRGNAHRRLAPVAGNPDSCGHGGTGGEANEAFPLVVIHHNTRVTTMGTVAPSGRRRPDDGRHPEHRHGLRGSRWQRGTLCRVERHHQAG
jgi:hypothetical protein